MLHISWHHSCVMYIYIPSVNKASRHRTQCVRGAQHLIVSASSVPTKAGTVYFFQKARWQDGAAAHVDYYACFKHKQVILKMLYMEFARKYE